MTPEGKVKRKVTNLLKQLGVYYFTPQSGGYGKSGVPDIIACCNGRFVGVECKAGTNKLTDLQSAQLDKIVRAGGTCYVVNEQSFASFEITMCTLMDKPLDR